MAAIAAGFGPMKTMPAAASACAKRLALRQEAVARMHRLGAAVPAGRDDLVDDEVALGGGRRPDRDRLVGHLDVQRVLVGLGIDRDGRDAHAAGGLDDAAGDLAAIGDQDALEHAARLWPRVSGPQGLRRQREKVNRQARLVFGSSPPRPSLHQPAAAPLGAHMRGDPFQDLDVDGVELGAALAHAQAAGVTSWTFSAVLGAWPRLTRDGTRWGRSSVGHPGLRPAPAD